MCIINNLLLKRANSVRESVILDKSVFILVKSKSLLAGEGVFSEFHPKKQKVNATSSSFLSHR